MTEEELPPATQQPLKVDPETLVLRGRPARVTRFRRGAILAIAATGSASLAGIAWLALKPPSFHLAAASDDIQLPQKPAADVLPGAPRTYGDVPKLGPPLPGDLGRPILEHQRESAGAGIGADAAQARAARLEAERERELSELRSARQSPVLAQLSSTRAQPAALLTDPSARLEPEPAAERGGAELAGDPNGQRHKLDFVSRETGSGGGVDPHRLAPPASSYMLSAGTVLAASLLTGLNSDLPGLVTAQITENAFDSATGRILLVPQGARLIGDYDSVVAFGQRRALVVWKRIIFPDGSAMEVDNLPATDTAGYAGLSDRIDLHSWQLLKGAGLSTLLGVGAELTIGGDGDLISAVRDSIQQNAARTGDQIVSRNLNVQPTLRVRPGWPLRVLISKDLVLKPWARNR